MLLRSEEGGRPEEKHCAADLAEKHCLPAVNLLHKVLGQSGLTLSYVCSCTAIACRLKNTVGGSRQGMGRNSAIGGARRAVACGIGRIQREYW